MDDPKWEPGALVARQVGRHNSWHVAKVAKVYKNGRVVINRLQFTPRGAYADRPPRGHVNSIVWCLMTPQLHARLARGQMVRDLSRRIGRVLYTLDRIAKEPQAFSIEEPDTFPMAEFKALDAATTKMLEALK